MLGDLLHRRVTCLRVDRIVERGQQVNNGIDVDKVVAEDVEPDCTGEVEAHGQPHEEEGDPLVVSDAVRQPLLPPLFHCHVHGQVVGVLDEAQVVRIVDPRTREVRGSPTSAHRKFSEKSHEAN